MPAWKACRWGSANAAKCPTVEGPLRALAVGRPSSRYQRKWRRKRKEEGGKEEAGGKAERRSGSGPGTRRTHHAHYFQGHLQVEGPTTAPLHGSLLGPITGHAAWAAREKLQSNITANIVFFIFNLLVNRRTVHVPRRKHERSPGTPADHRSGRPPRTSRLPRLTNRGIRRRNRWRAQNRGPARFILNDLVKNR